jgi:hypothetical protein
MKDKAMLADFEKGLSPSQQKTFQATVTERDAAWQRFRGLGAAVPPSS